VRPHRFQDLFYDAVFNFFQSGELLPKFVSLACAPAAVSTASGALLARIFRGAAAHSG
jgi:hypothetical protein